MNPGASLLRRPSQFALVYRFMPRRTELWFLRPGGDEEETAMKSILVITIRSGLSQIDDSTLWYVFMHQYSEENLCNRKIRMNRFTTLQLLQFAKRVRVVNQLNSTTILPSKLELLNIILVPHSSCIIQYKHHGCVW